MGFAKHGFSTTVTIGQPHSSSCTLDSTAYRASHSSIEYDREELAGYLHEGEVVEDVSKCNCPE